MATTPNKSVRKYFFDALTAEGLPVFDTRTGLDKLGFYVLLSVQTNTVRSDNKCGDYFEHNIIIEILQVFAKTGNAVSRIQINDAEEKVLDAYYAANFDGFEIRDSDFNSSDQTTEGVYESVVRTIFNLTFKLYRK